MSVLSEVIISVKSEGYGAILLKAEGKTILILRITI